MDNSGGRFTVTGTHIYAEGGTYPIKVVITAAGGIGATVTATGQISDLLYQISGGAASSSGGAISSTGFTTSNTPIFTGTAEPNSTVFVYAISSSATNPLLIAKGRADAAGNFSIPSTSTLADGQYTIEANATDHAGRPSSAMTTLYPTASRGVLTVDTQGPTVTGASLNPRTGKVTITLGDAISGLASAGELNSANFGLTLASNGKSFAVTGLTVSPVTPTTTQTITLTFATGRKPLAKGTYVLSINASGVTDNAGNPLDERYFIPFPGLYNKPGQNFVASFATDGKTVTSAQQFIPPSEVAAAKKLKAFFKKHTRAPLISAGASRPFDPRESSSVTRSLPPSLPESDAGCGF